ncbi:hypothetical protein JOD43_003587 [Pullulanibacillus pueri]|nr:hypothetical protein [Pullulanibacillus pueri]
MTHFTYQPFLSKQTRRREYRISFFYKGQLYNGIYHYDGQIDWDERPDEADIKKLTTQVHEFMLFHVYDA